MKKFISFIATSAILLNSLYAPISALAQEVSPTPEPTPEATSTPDPTPEITPAPTEDPTPTPSETPIDLATPTAEPTVIPEETLTPASTDQPIQTQAPESVPTTPGPPTETSIPEASSTPIFTPAVTDENAEITTQVVTKEIFPETVQENSVVKLITDKLDYSPTEIAIISGSGFTPDKTYSLTVSSTDDPATSTTVDITTNRSGEFKYEYQLDGNYRPNYSVDVKDGDELIASTSFTDTDWPDCKFQCEAKDTTITKLELVKPDGSPITSCEQGTSVSAKIVGTFDNTFGSQRYSVILSGDIYEGSTNIKHFATSGIDGQCVTSTLATGVSTVDVATINWMCGGTLSIKNLVLSWDTGTSTCSDFFKDPKCAQRTTKCYGGLTTEVPVVTPLTADFTAPPVCLGTATTFTSTTTGGVVPYTNYAWTFGDSYAGSGQTTTHTYTGVGTFQAKLTVTDSKPQTDDQTYDVIVNQCAYCGDGIKNGTEQCDGTSGVGASQFCTNACKLVNIYDGGNSCPTGTTPVKIDSLTINSKEDPNGKTTEVTAGKNYLFEAVGDYGYGGSPLDNENNRADAGYTTANNWSSRLDSQYGISSGAAYRGITSLLSDWGTVTMGLVNWGAYNSDHTYTKLYSASSNASVKFVISDWYDDWYNGGVNNNQGGVWDNQGSLTLNVYECQPETLSVSINKVDDIDPAHGGDLITYTLNWSISGNVPASNVKLTEVPVNVGDSAFDSSKILTDNPDWKSCGAGVYCYTLLGTKNPGDSGNVTFKLRVLADATGSQIQNSVTLSAQKPDKEWVSNSDTEYTGILKPITIKAYKVICDSEQYLPNWGNHGSTIGAITAQTFVNSSNGHCRLATDWKFQYGGIGSFGDFQKQTDEKSSPWQTFNVNSDAVINDLSSYGGKIEVREVFPDNTYIGFSNDTAGVTNPQSAEFYCSGDVYNYDNWEWINSPQYGQTYYCVGFNAPKYGSISVHKFEDKNKDGQQNNGDQNLQGWQMYLYSGSACTFTALIKNGPTNSDGIITFDNLVPGTYSVYDNYYWTNPNTNPAEPTNGSACRTITISAGQSQTIDFGNFISWQLTGKKFVDTNGNGIWNAGESPKQGVRIEFFVYNNGQWIVSPTNGSYITKADGSYTYQSFDPRPFKVCEVVPTGWQRTMPSSSNCYEITPESGGNYTNYDFGNFKLTYIQGRKFNDLNANGAQDSGEPEINGWTIRLYDSTWHQVGADQQTHYLASDGEGRYRFENLFKGTYYICEVLQTGWEQTDPADSEGFANLSPNKLTEGPRCHQVNIATSGTPVEGKIFGNFEMKPAISLTKANNIAGSTSAGAAVTYTIVVSNGGNTELNGVDVTDFLPGGFAYVASTSKLGGAAIADPAISANGSVLYWENVGNISPTETLTITYQVTINSDAANGIYTNYAVSKADYGLSIAEHEAFIFSVVHAQETKTPKEIESNLDNSAVSIGNSLSYGGTLGGGQVLGASTVLPATGSPTWILLGAMGMITGGVFLNIYSRKERRKYEKN